MSSLRPGIDRSPLGPGEVLGRHLTGIRADLDPDPLFRRRLRGGVVNRFVAVHEGLERPATRRSDMGQLGRACLYASVALAVSVGGVMATARAAVPGDLLYPVKLEIEALRMRALPTEFHDDLILYALSERLHEMGRLADAADWDAVAALAPQIEAGYHQLAAIGMEEVLSDQGLQHRVEVLEMLRDRVPAPAQPAIDGRRGPAPEGDWRTSQGEAGGQGASEPGAPNKPNQAGMPAGPSEPAESPEAQGSAKATATPRPTPTGRPVSEPRPTPPVWTSHGAEQEPNEFRAQRDSED
jgi:hypothetical protein